MRKFAVDLCYRPGRLDVLPLLREMIEFDPPPNQHGIRFLEGLAERDASWLHKIASDKKRCGLAEKDLRELLSTATKSYRIRLQDNFCASSELTAVIEQFSPRVDQDALP